MSSIRGGRPADVVLTTEERRAIAALKRLAARWPDSLWLFSAGGALNVMRRDEDGERAFTRMTGNDVVDPEYRVADIDIPNDGGDW